MLKNYSFIDSIPDELIHTEFTEPDDPAYIKGRTKKALPKWNIEMDGVTYEVVSRILTNLEAYREYGSSGGYDPQSTLALCGADKGGYRDKITGMIMDNPIWLLFNERHIDDSTKLDEKTSDKRSRVFIHILARCLDVNVVRELVKLAPKKKNGLLYKGRLLHIAHRHIVDTEGMAKKLVIKNETDTKMTLEVRDVGVNSGWLNDPDVLTTTDLFF